MSTPPPLGPDLPAPLPAKPVSRRRSQGFLPPRAVRGVSFCIISVCIFASVLACILAVWDFTKKDSLWRLIASFIVVGAGTALFAWVNGVFGDDEPG